MRKWWTLGLVLSLMWGSAWFPAARTAVAAGGGPVVAGRMADAAGRPVAGALVQVIAGDGRLAGEGLSDAGGRFRVETGLKETDLFRVRAWAAGYRLGTSAWQGAWDTREPYVILIPHGGRIQGVVTGADGRPAPGATVQLRAGGGRVAAVATAGEGGRYQLAALPGEWWLAGDAGGAALAARKVKVTDGGIQVADLSAADHAVRIVGQAVDAVTRAPLLVTRVEVHRTGYGIIAAGASEPGGTRFVLTVPAVAEAALTLRVWTPEHEMVESAPFAAPAGRDVEFTGVRALAARSATAAIAGVLVHPWGTRAVDAEVWVERDGMGVLQSVRTDENGRFRFAGLPAGPGVRYRVSANPPGHLVARSAWLEPGAGEERLVVLAGVMGQHFGDPFWGSVMGSVVDPTGLPVPGAEVSVQREGAGTWVSRGTTDAGGLFSLQLSATRGEGATAAAAGYRIRVSHPDYIATEQVGGGLNDIVHLSRDEIVSLSVTLRPRHAQWTGRVVDGSGAPVAGATLRVLDPAGRRVAADTTGGTGAYHLGPIPAAGYPAYRVTVEDEGFFAAQLPARDVASLAETLPDLVLMPGTGTVSGRVTDMRGAPVPRASVRAAIPGAGPLRAVSDADGRWRLAGVPAGVQASLVVDGGPDWFQVTPPPVYLAPGAEEERDVVLFPAVACLAGRVSAAPGRPLAGVQVRLFREGAGLVATATTGADGQFRLAALPTLSGWYLLEAEAEGYRPAVPGAGLFPLLSPASGGCARSEVLLAPAEP